jgi:prevent-host-death family protein
MQTVCSCEAKTHLLSLLDRVSKGERITITKHGQPVAVLVPPIAAKGRAATAVIAELKLLRKGRKLRGVSIRDLIEEGRRH